jgi:hypothetical protein
VKPRPAPNNLLIYRLLTGSIDAIFCQRVSEALSLGYVLHGAPTVTANGERVIVTQAVVWPHAANDADVLAT